MGRRREMVAVRNLVRNGQWKTAYVKQDAVEVKLHGRMFRRTTYRTEGGLVIFEPSEWADTRRLLAALAKAKYQAQWCVICPAHWHMPEGPDADQVHWMRHYRDRHGGGPLPERPWGIGPQRLSPL